MDTRPKIEIEKTASDRTIAAMGWLILAGMWMVPALAYASLPAQIPMHYNASNEVDGYGSKAGIFLLPAIGTFVFALLALVKRHTDKLNYPVAITAGNAAVQYHLAWRVLTVLQATATVVFCCIELQTVSPAFHGAMGAWILPISVALIIAPVTYLIVKSIRHK